MLYKQRKMPKILSGLLALEKRLPRNHEQYAYIKKELYKSRAGYEGELEYDRYMKEVRTDYPHAILHDLSLHHEGVYFQIDSLFITPNAIIISEIKNMADKIIIKANPTQFIQTSLEGNPKVFRSPIAETERKIQFLERWLARRNVQIEVSGIIVFAYNNEIIMEKQPSMPVFTAYEVPTYFRSLTSNNPLFGEEEIMKIAKALSKAHREYNPYPLADRYQIAREDMRKGVYCSECEFPSVMEWTNRRWECRTCGIRESNSHHQTIAEWFMLMPGKLTNQAFCDFAGVPNRHIAKRMLARAKLKHQGLGRGSRYDQLPK